MFENRVVLITGAGSGIGFDTACKLLDLSALVIGCDISETGLKKLNDYADKTGKQSQTVRFDISQVEAHPSVIKIVEKIGHLDCLINCAGICSAASIEEMSVDLWDKTYSVNLRGPFFLTQKLIPFLKKGTSSSIINISSMAGFTGGIKSNPAYSSSKAAVTCMTKNLAKYCAQFMIRVNEVSPGTTMTAMTEKWMGKSELDDFVRMVPLGRLAVADDISDRKSGV